MREKNWAIIVFVVFLALGLLFLYFHFLISPFNFYKSEIEIQGNKVVEKLYFQPDKDYHTLFRNFESYVYTQGYESGTNSIFVDKVECNSGQAYVRGYFGACKVFDSIDNSCPGYTENNELGCSFGYELGFIKGNEYTIKSEYELNPDTLIKINNNYYIKFVAYSMNNHKILRNGKNFFVNGGIINNLYLQENPVIIYIPFNGDTSKYSIIEQASFDYKTDYFKIILPIFFSVFPALLFFFSWLWFGRERSYEDVPEELSEYPEKRKGWEVAAFFNPAFGDSKRVFSSTLLYFYNKKIIDVKVEEEGIFSKKVTYIKLNNKFDANKLDKIEKKVYDLLVLYKDFMKDEQKEGYFPLDVTKKSSFDFSKMIEDAAKKEKIRKGFLEFESSLKEETKKYIDSKGAIIIYLVLVLGIIVSFLASSIFALLFFISLIIFVMINNRSALFVRFKQDNYIEYEKWQSFKRYLNSSVSMVEADSKAVVLWDQYLVYATALGVSKKVLKTLKEKGIIDERQYNTYNGIYVSSMAFSSTSGGTSSGHGGGGVGGGGGGGVGGGGGGGR